MTTTLHTIGSAIPPAGGGAPGSAGLLQTQLGRYEVKLADWCSCPGGKTPEGKKIIADLQQKADAVKAQLQKMDAARVQQAPSAAPTAGVTQPLQGDALSLAGSRVDVFA